MRARVLASIAGLVMFAACSGQASETDRATQSSVPPSAAASVVASAGPSGTSELEGVWHTGVITPDDAMAALQAKDLGQYAQFFFDFWNFGEEEVFTLRVSGGRWVCYRSSDGGLDIEDDSGTYAISGNTVTIRHDEGSDTHQWSVTGDTLTITYLSDTIGSDPPVGEEVYQTVLYMSSPWTRAKP